MKIIVKDTEPKVLSNGYENYEERKLDERNERQRGHRSCRPFSFRQVAPAETTFDQEKK